MLFRSGVDKADDVKGGVDGCAQEGGQSDEHGDVAGALHPVIKGGQVLEQEGANDGADGIANSRAESEEAQGHAVHKGKHDRAEGDAGPEAVTEQEDGGQRDAGGWPDQGDAARKERGFFAKESAEEIDSGEDDHSGEGRQASL